MNTYAEIRGHSKTLSLYNLFNNTDKALAPALIDLTRIFYSASLETK